MEPFVRRRQPSSWAERAAGVSARVGQTNKRLQCSLFVLINLLAPREEVGSGGASRDEADCSAPANSLAGAAADDDCQQIAAHSRLASFPFTRGH